MIIIFADGDYSTSVPLSHDVAKHRMAIRPKRKHGNPRSKKPVSLDNPIVLFLISKYNETSI